MPISLRQFTRSVLLRHQHRHLMFHVVALAVNQVNVVTSQAELLLMHMQQLMADRQFRLRKQLLLMRIFQRQNQAAERNRIPLAELEHSAHGLDFKCHACIRISGMFAFIAQKHLHRQAQQRHRNNAPACHIVMPCVCHFSAPEKPDACIHQ